MPDDVLKEQDEAAGGKYRRAIERMGDFGKLFVECEGDPRGPVGRAGGMSIEDEAQTMPVLTDVDGGQWRPVQEEVLQDLLKQLGYWKEQSLKARCEKQRLIEKAEKSERLLDSILEDEEKAPFDPFSLLILSGLPLLSRKPPPLQAAGACHSDHRDRTDDLSS